MGPKQYSSGSTADEVLRQLDEDASKMASFSSVYLTARVVLSPEAFRAGIADSAQAAERLRLFNRPVGFSWTNVEVIGEFSLGIRAALIASRGATAGADIRQVVLAALGEGLVASVEVEQ